MSIPDRASSIFLRIKGLTTVIEELKQRVLAKIAKVKRYEQRIKQ